MALKSLNAKGKIVALGELKNAQAVAKRRKTSGIIITLIFLLIVGVMWYIFNHLPPSGKVELIRPVTAVKSPANAEVLWHAPLGMVKIGDKVATLLIRSDDNFEEMLQLKAQRISALQNSAFELERQIAKFKSDQHQGLISINRQKSLFKSDMLLLKKRQRELKNSAERLEKSRRLWNLDAIKKPEFSAVQNNYDEAVHLSAAANLAQVERIKRIALEEQSLKLTTARTKAEEFYLTQLNSSINILSENLKKINRGIKKTPDGLEVSLYAPLSGEVVDIVAPQGSVLDAKSTVVEILRPQSERLIAYLQPKYRHKVTLNSRVMAKFGDVYFNTKIKAIHSTLQRLPKALRPEATNPEALYWVIELDNRNIPQELSNGELGEAVFYD